MATRPHTTVAAGLATGSIIRAGRATITEPSDTSILQHFDPATILSLQKGRAGYSARLFIAVLRAIPPAMCGQGKSRGSDFVDAPTWDWPPRDASSWRVPYGSRPRWRRWAARHPLPAGNGCRPAPGRP